MGNKGYFFSLATLAIAFGFLAYVTFLLFQPFDEPSVVEPFPVLNENKTVRIGNDVKYEISFQKFEDVQVTSLKTIVCADGNIVTLASTQTNAPVGVHKAVAEQRIPSTTSLGECYISFNITYHVNKLKDVKRIRKTEIFTVIN